MIGWHASDVFPLPSDDKPKGICSRELEYAQFGCSFLVFAVFFFNTTYPIRTAPFG